MAVKNRCCILTCYIGTLPAWTQQWLESCRYNINFDFIVITDDRTRYNIPQNVSFLYTELSELKNRFQKEIEFPICLESAYKLCDYRPLYGLAFCEELAGYEFWGHCDMDMIFGDLSRFLTDDIFNSYDRIGTFGALILYRNDEKMNHLYKLPGAAFTYKVVFSNPESYNFDEVFGYNLICKRNDIKWYNYGHSFILDKKRESPLCFAEVKNAVKQRVLWKNRKIYLLNMDLDNNMSVTEYMYFHFSQTYYDMKEFKDNVVFSSNKCHRIQDKELYMYLLNEKEEINEKNKGCLDKFLKKTFRQKYIRIRQEMVRQYIDRRYYKHMDGEGRL